MDKIINRKIDCIRENHLIILTCEAIFKDEKKCYVNKFVVFSFLHSKDIYI